MIWHSSEIENVLSELKTNKENGLWSSEVDERIEIYGKNTTAITHKNSLLTRFLSQLKNKVVYFLITVAIITFIVNLIYNPNNFYFPILIIAIVFLNAFISAFHLYKCDLALDEIQNASNPKVEVIRDNKKQFIPSDLLVPGDIIILNEGDYITADARLIATDLFRCNESVLSGDIIPVEKDANAILEDITLSTARKNMVFAGCSVVHGNATAVVVETGLRTEIGKITDINRQTNSETLPITDSLNKSGKKINTAILIICVIAFLIGIIQNFNTAEPFASITVNSLLNAVALGICAMPESLPAISTIVIALGIHRMINDRVIIKNTKALELLGQTEVFCVDKTGILTKNNMELNYIYDGEELIDISADVIPEKALSALQLTVSCSMLENDSTEKAIENACEKLTTMSKVDIGNLFPRLAQISFDSTRKTMTSINMIGGTPVAVVKGAPEVLIEKCSLQNKDTIYEVYKNLTKDSYRAICVAIKKLDEIPSSPDPELIENELTFVGLLALYDPPQSDTVEAIKTCKMAGINTIMMTGDNIDTAKTIARRIGILQDDSQAISGTELSELTDTELCNQIEKYTVYARISPEDKIRIINAWQKKEKIVAVTGNGTEDADALSVADIGCSVGSYGTDIAKGNADVIIENKKFMSVVNSICESRGLFENVKKSVSYLLSCNFGEILAFILGMLFFGMPPLAALQLLWINLLTDSTSVISLTTEKSELDVMRKKPIALSGHLFSKGASINIACDAIVIAALTLISFAIGGSTMAFSTLSMVQIFHSFNLKTHDTIIKADFKGNKFMNYTSVLVLFIALFLVITPAGYVFGLEVLSFGKLLLSLALSISIIPICEIKKLFSRIIAKKIF